MITKRFKAKGMHCSSCETLIKNSVTELEGIEHVSVDYAKEEVNVRFDPEKVRSRDIIKIIEEKGYSCFSADATKDTNVKKSSNLTGIIFSIIGILVFIYFILRFAEGLNVPQITQNMGYGLLFIVGLLTGFHCISMCGGFVIGYTTKDAEKGIKPYRSHIAYGTGKLISYTVIGAAFGLLGSLIAFTPAIRGIAGILAGIFLLIYGLNMLNLVPWLRNIRIKPPAFINRFTGEESKKHSNNPLIIGLLNGLMIACGPLQAIYIMAAGTGSMVEGAKLLFIFALGTLPVMLGFGFLTSMISKKATQKILKASGVIVILLGLIMINRGLALTGTGLDTTSLISTVSADNSKITGSAIEMVDDYQIIRMDVTRSGWNPDKFVLKKDVPVRWIINGKEINGCNNAIQVPKLGLKFDIKPGEQTIEFTPTEEGIIPWSCWMGMIPGTFIVKSDIDLQNKEEIQKELISVPTQSTKSTCGCGCGG